MKDVLTYTSYRQYIADYYADKKAKSAFTWQEFATSAGFSSPVYLKYVSEGRFNLSETAAVRVAHAMNLADYECDFFVELVKFDHAKTDAEKKAAYGKMISIAEAHKAKSWKGTLSVFSATGKILSFANWLLPCRGRNPWRLPMPVVKK